MSHCIDLMGCINGKQTESNYDESEDDEDELSESPEESEVKSTSDMIESFHGGYTEEGYRVHWDDEASEEYTIPGFSSRPTTARRYSSNRSAQSSEYVYE